ncbi:MAG: P-II family nitrogen regulator [Candidatus Scalindua sp.]
MKLIKVILRPEKEFELKDVLCGIGYHGITAKDSSGFGESKKIIKQVYRGDASGPFDKSFALAKLYEQRADAVKRKEIEFVVPDDKVEKVVETIRKIATTAQGGDRRIYIFPMDNAIHIHSGDRHLGDSSEEDLKNE